ncbi:RecB-like helicase [Helicobacter marmotae]|uniref:DNA 3'-5' helicase n=1 Tax=Helicobacter marmotae TaxID=152490 RepID=A0A3D8I257_9HELI|nr:RecB-like helicase [Helicobacter marmotae]RDU59220.1 RecB-like helicase [Helicobacter marmotae]
MRESYSQYLALKASAGSGKTFNLALRFIYLLFCGANPNQILTLTFTKKASNEMRQRIYKNLQELKTCLEERNYANNHIYKDLLEKGLGHEYLSENIQRVYREFMESNPRIGTIDSFFHVILKKFCWYVGVSAYFEVGSLDEDAINECFLNVFSPDELDSFVNFCFYHGVKIGDFLTFLQELYSLPANDVKRALQTLKEAQDSSLSAQSIEAIELEVKSLMESIAEHVSDKRAKDHFLNKTCREIPKSNYLLRWSEHRDLKKDASSLNAITHVRDRIVELMSAYFVKKEQNVLGLVRAYLELYRQSMQKQLRAQNYLSHSDVALKSYELLQLNDDMMDFFYFRLDDKITHILLDEFQDTNLIQYQILLPLIEEIRAGVGRIGERSLFIVGDKKQSIYMFRGSFAGIFEEATKNFHEENLPYNFRSSAEVVSFNNQVFQKCYKDYEPQSPKATDDSPIKQGYVRILPQAEDEDALKEQVYNELQALLDNGADENDITILVFTNDDALSLKEHINMRNAKIQVITETSASLFDKAEVKAMLYAFEYFKLSLVKTEQWGLRNALKLYEKRICKLLGYAYEDSTKVYEVLKSIDTSLLPAEIVLALIEGFGLSQNTALRFLELSCEYVSIDSLLEAVSKITCNAPAQSNRGVKIMTIHKSKGLEFKHVIVCDRMRKPKADSNKFICSYQGIHIQHIYYKLQGRERFDTNYANALESYKERLKQEAYNVLYVAFTRAAYGLSIAPMQSSKHKSQFEILSLEERYDELGQFDRVEKPKEQHIGQKNVLQDMQYFGKQSEFLKHERESHAEVLSIEQWHNIKFGEALHSVFELYLGYKMPEEDIESVLFNRYGFALSKESIAQAMKYTLSCIQSPFFMEISAGKSVACEVSYITEDCLYRIDTLLYDEKEYCVLDYKSGTGNFETQKEQVMSYMKFLDSMDSRRVRGFIVYPLKEDKERFCEVSL